MYIPPGSAEEMAAAIVGMDRCEDDVVILLLGERNRPDVERLIGLLDESGVEFFGGIFPGLICGTQRFEDGAVVAVFPSMGKPFLVEGLDGNDFFIPEFDPGLDHAAERRPTALVLVDGLTANISLFLQEIFNRLGDAVSYLGGGAGSLSLEPQPCLFTRDGFFQDAAIVVFIDLQSQLGVRHGWAGLMGPLIATRTRRNVIVELNWRSAFEVYREVVEADSGRELNQDNFFEIAKGYPFGIYKEGSEEVVRDPIAVNEAGELICVGEVPENATLSILKGEEEALIEAAARAAGDCLEKLPGPMRASLIVDCISRVIFLEQNFDRELEGIVGKIRSVDAGQTPIGILSLGEISSYGEGFLELFNKTSVVALLHD